ncbi:hypothetical protein PIN31009_04123 [Pandoraea iniqua]|nr:hypothetical protein PIN31009_04123 [Pandoraea iniqua]
MGGVRAGTGIGAVPAYSISRGGKGGGGSRLTLAAPYCAGRR